MQHKLETIEDIYKVLNKDNIENFMIDFRKWIEFHKEMETMNEQFESIMEIKFDNKKFIWIDDNKNDVELIIKTK